MQKRTSNDSFYDFEEKLSDIMTAIGVVLTILMILVVMAMACNWIHSFSNLLLSNILQ